MKFALQTPNFLIRPHPLGDVPANHHGPGDGAFFVMQRQGGVADDFMAAVETLDVDHLVKGGFTVLDGADRRPVICADALARVVPPALAFATLLDANLAFASPDTAAGGIIQDEMSGCIRYPHPDRQHVQHAAQLPPGFDGAPHDEPNAPIDQQCSDHADARHDRNRLPHSGTHWQVYLLGIYFAHHAETQFRHRHVGRNDHYAPVIRCNSDAALPLQGVPHRDMLIVVAHRRQERARHENRWEAGHMFIAGTSAHVRFHPARRLLRKEALKFRQGLLNHDSSLPLRREMNFQHPSPIPGQPDWARIFKAKTKLQFVRGLPRCGTVGTCQPREAIRAGQVSQQGCRVRAGRHAIHPCLQAAQCR